MRRRRRNHSSLRFDGSAPAVRGAELRARELLGSEGETRSKFPK